jgi:predicted ATPase
MATSISAQYAAGVAAGRFGSDDAQLAIVEKLSRLEARIAERANRRRSAGCSAAARTTRRR